jgi:hypothetical protein
VIWVLAEAGIKEKFKAKKLKVKTTMVFTNIISSEMGVKSQLDNILF